MNEKTISSPFPDGLSNSLRNQFNRVHIHHDLSIEVGAGGRNPGTREWAC